MASILLLGPDRKRAAGIRSILRQDGHHVGLVRSTEDWRITEHARTPDLVVAAVESSDAVLGARGRLPSGFPAPLLFVQHDADFCRDPYLDERLVDRITSPFLGEDLLARVDALVQVRRVLRAPSGTAGADGSANKRGGLGLAKRLSSLLGVRVPRRDKPRGPYLEVAARVAEWADRRDAFEPGHAERVTSICATIAEGLDVNDDETESLLRAARLHDIGKVALPVKVLHQQEPLEEHQMRLIRTHPRRGASLLRVLDRDDDVAATILYHHERPNGTGYYGLKAESIPRAARILSVAEVYDAMTSTRLRQPLSSGQALELLSETRGEIHDADCVDALTDRLKPRGGTIALASQLIH